MRDWLCLCLALSLSSLPSSLVSLLSLLSFLSLLSLLSFLSLLSPLSSLSPLLSSILSPLPVHFAQVEHKAIIEFDDRLSLCVVRDAALGVLVRRAKKREAVSDRGHKEVPSLVLYLCLS